MATRHVSNLGLGEMPKIPASYFHGIVGESWTLSSIGANSIAVRATEILGDELPATPETHINRLNIVKTVSELIVRREIDTVASMHRRILATSIVALSEEDRPIEVLRKNLEAFTPVYEEAGQRVLETSPTAMHEFDCSSAREFAIMSLNAVLAQVSEFSVHKDQE